ncbi:hypothetical protein [Kribbella sp. ALI-6-A]|nr:hypothetical protein [Kribbella sp. ALI-6-A]
MRTDEIKAVIDQVAALIREHYVFPDVGPVVADRLMRRPGCIMSS